MTLTLSDVIRQFTDIRESNEQMLIEACEKNNLRFIRELLPSVTSMNPLLIWASNNGHVKLIRDIVRQQINLEVIQELLQDSAVDSFDNYLIEWIVDFGWRISNDKEIFNELIKNSSKKYLLEHINFIYDIENFFN